MFCSHCSIYVSNQESQCPVCGQFLFEEAKGKISHQDCRETYYCKRCKRYLPSQICSIHGLDDTIAVGSDDSVKFKMDQVYSVPVSHPPHEIKPQSAQPAVAQSSREETVPQRKTRPTIPRFNPKNGNGSHQPTHIVSANASRNFCLEDLIEQRLNALHTESTGNSYSKVNGAKNVQPQRRLKAKNGSQTSNINHKRRQSEAFKREGVKRRWVLLSLTMLILSGIIATGLLFYPDIHQYWMKTTLLTDAEQSLQDNRYQQAIIAYERYREQFPNDPALEQIESKIEQIRDLQKVSLEMKEQINSLMEKAGTAVQEQRFVNPENDNATDYLSRVLALDPDYPPALKLQEQLTDHFFNKGSAALSKDNLTRAIYYYKAILAMKPGDPLLLDKINQTLQKKSVTVLLHSFGEIAKTRQQIEQIRTERLRLQEMLATEGQKISDLARQSKGIQQLPTKKTEPRTTRPKAPIQQTVSNEQTSKTKVQTASIGSSFQESLGIELLPPSEKEDTETKIVEEALIDGGAKKVTHREKPEITPELKESDEFVMILAECTVGKDGTVEKVNLLSGARDKKLNQLATTAFQKYRYQPATYNGEPVRFKTIEVMSF